MKTDHLCATVFALFASFTIVTSSAQLPEVPMVELQPLAAQVRRLIDAMEYLGEPFSAKDVAALEKAMTAQPAKDGVAAIQRIMDARTLLGVHINPEMRVKVVQGPAKAVLVEKGWRQYLVKVANEAGTTAPLRGVSPQARAVHNARSVLTNSDMVLGGDHAGHVHPTPHALGAWLDLQMFDAQPMRPTLTGLALEYRIIQLYSRDAGMREAKLLFDVGQGTQDLGFRSDADLLFTCLPAREIKLRVVDNGKAATAAFVIRDAQGRVYPSQAKRLAPDFAFHPQVYRADGETLDLPYGEYVVEYRRGPESISHTRKVKVDDSSKEWSFQIDRWVDPAKLGWWSGDHHIHAAGCAHYTNPMEGVLAEDMVRHCQGEDLKIGANLTWGPGFDFQKQFFTGREDDVSNYPYLLRYDIEVSGFGSHRSGHLCLLRLRNQMYPGGDSSDHWPTLGMNTIRWAKAQGAVVGPAHSGSGLQPVMPGDLTRARYAEITTITNELPNYVVPPYNGIGANEYIMNVTHEVPGPGGQLVPAVDFISLVDTPYVWELNMWYHTLNAGFRTRGAGETDFPCIYGDRVGMGRSYVKLDGRLNYDEWCDGIRVGRSYVSDGKSHLFDFKVNDQEVGVNGSELRLSKPGTINVTGLVAARLDESPNPAFRGIKMVDKPFWDLERARIGETRDVAVEVVVNGLPIAQQTICADGTTRDFSFEIPIERSSWVAVRVLGSSHTNPIFILVGDKPIRASRRSVEWCLKGVDQCWSQKEQFYAASELAQARADYEYARRVYRQRLTECDLD